MNTRHFFLSAIRPRSERGRCKLFHVPSQLATARSIQNALMLMLMKLAHACPLRCCSRFQTRCVHPGPLCSQFCLTLLTVVAARARKTGGLLPVIPPASVGGTRDPSERRAVVACILRVGTLGASSGHGCDTSHSGSTSTGTASGRTAGPMRGREHSSHLRAHAAGKQQPANVTSAVAESPLDVFFILRASRRGVGSDGSGGGGGRWSGQVAFPGGHVEIGETDHDAVVREVREEVGLDLRRRGGYRLLGEVTPRSVSVATGTLVLRCMVFLQMDEGEATVPDPNEV